MNKLVMTFRYMLLSSSELFGTQVTFSEAMMGHDMKRDIDTKKHTENHVKINNGPPASR